MVDKITPAGMPGLGLIEAKTSNYGGHPPEFWAERLTEKIVSTSESEDPYIKEQAKAYRDAIYQVCLIYIKNALKSYKASLIQDLIGGGEEELAKIINKVSRIPVILSGGIKTYDEKALYYDLKSIKGLSISRAFLEKLC